jgi:hypothetical protein
LKFLGDWDMARLRFLAKFAMDVLRTALASVVGAFLFSHVWTQESAPPVQRVAVAANAGEEAAQVIRDEHDVMVQYLKAKHEEQRAELEKEVREAQAARMAHDKVAPVRQADVEPAKTVPSRLGPAPRAGSTSGINMAANPAGTSNATNAAVVVAGASSSAAGTAPTTVVAASLPPPAEIQALPDAAMPNQIDPQRDPSRDQSRPPNLAEQAVAVTHVNDVVSFVHDVASWFRHEDAPVPPAEVHTNPFADGPM